MKLILFILILLASVYCDQIKIINISYQNDYDNYDDLYDLYDKAKCLCVNENYCVVVRTTDGKVAIGQPIIEDYQCAIKHMDFLQPIMNNKQFFEFNAKTNVSKELLDHISTKCVIVPTLSDKVGIICILGLFMATCVSIAIFIEYDYRYDNDPSRGKNNERDKRNRIEKNLIIAIYLLLAFVCFCPLIYEGYLIY